MGIIKRLPAGIYGNGYRRSLDVYFELKSRQMYRRNNKCSLINGFIKRQSLKKLINNRSTGISRCEFSKLVDFR